MFYVIYLFLFCFSGPQWTNRQVTRCWAECREEFRYNLDILDCLVRAHLINLQQFDMQLASVLEQALNAGIGSSILALGFAMQLVHVYLLEGPASGAPMVITENDLANTIEILTRIAAHARYFKIMFLIILYPIYCIFMLFFVS
jgi:CCR4-NOT transcription complex subunit 1